MAHIIIIGAGASGLMAASLLVKQNHCVTILEARNRTGGRIHTLRNEFSIPLDAGAEFIHGQQPVTLALLKEASIKPLLIQGNRYQHWKGSWQKGDIMDDAWRKVDQALRELKDDITMAAFLEQNFNKPGDKDLRDRVTRYVEGYDIADINRVSALAIKKEWEVTDDEHQYHLADGYQAMISYLEQRVITAGGTISLSSPVQKIEWLNGKVSISTTTNAIVEGDKVIVTVPLGVLQKKIITFEPPLQAHDAAIATMGFGGVIKFMFEFNSPFWEQNTEKQLKDLAFIFSDQKVPTWWTPLPSQAPILIGWLGGPSAFAASHDKDELYNIAVASLQRIFNLSPQALEKEIKHWHITDWITDAYALGGYAYATTDTAKAMGTVEAALSSGRRTAELIGMK
jgi:monoamine oxidase